MYISFNINISTFYYVLKCRRVVNSNNATVSTKISDKPDEANKAFSAAVQMHDTLVKAWALYGDYLEQVFTREPRQINLGVNAMTCFLHACRHQNESKARKYLAKVLWLLNYDDENSRYVFYVTV